MSDLMQRATTAARRAVARRVLRRQHSDEDDERLADEYARALGLHLSADEQVAWFKQHTEGAPLVHRPLRRSSV